MQFKVRTHEVTEKTYFVNADSIADAEEYVFDNYGEWDDEFFNDWQVLSVEPQ